MQRPAITALLTCLLISTAHTADDAVVSLIVENDVITGTDRHYTSGVLLSYVSGLDEGPPGAENFGRKLFFIDDDDQMHVGFSLGHEIYTPKDISNPDLIVDDRPYAGHLYGAVDFTISDDYELSTWRINMGIVGPSARAEDIQSDLHREIGSPIPRGWEHQLDDEFAWGLMYEKQWQWRPRKNTSFLPHAGVSIGNVSTHATVGAMFRVGRNLDADYGPPRLRPALPGSLFFKPDGDGTTWYFYLGVDGRYVAQNLFLDGNTSKDSHSVSRKNWVGDFQAGFVINNRRLRLAYSHVIRSKEFEGQDERSRFGSVTLAVRI